MKSFIISCNASFLLVTSRTSSVVMVDRPACREKLSRSIVTFSEKLCQVSIYLVDYSMIVNGSHRTYQSDAKPSQSMRLWIDLWHSNWVGLLPLPRSFQLKTKELPWAARNYHVSQLGRMRFPRMNSLHEGHHPFEACWETVSYYRITCVGGYFGVS